MNTHHNVNIKYSTTYHHLANACILINCTTWRRYARKQGPPLKWFITRDPVYQNLLKLNKRNKFIYSLKKDT